MFISSTSTVNEGGSGGLYDDAEEYIREKRVVFTTEGVALKRVAHFEFKFVRAVQEKMKEGITEYLRTT